MEEDSHIDEFLEDFLLPSTIAQLSSSNINNSQNLTNQSHCYSHFENSPIILPPVNLVDLNNNDLETSYLWESVHCIDSNVEQEPNNYHFSYDSDQQSSYAEDNRSKRLRLDHSYELKKSRAKVSRCELTSKFDELRKILGITKKSFGRRGVNRAKILDAAIEHIKKLQQEINEIRSKEHLLAQPFQRSIPMKSLSIKKGLVNDKGKSSCDTCIGNVGAIDYFTSTGNMFDFLDSNSITKCNQVCKAWSVICSSDRIWLSLCKKRWRFTEDEMMNAQTNEPISSMELYAKLHKQKAMPLHTYIRTTPIFAKGGNQHLNVWILLGHRSNCRTKRTCIIDNQVRVTEIVELRIVVQNIHSMDRIHLDTSASISTKFGDSVKMFNNCIESNLMSRLVEFNGKEGSAEITKALTLESLDFVVYTAYVACPGDIFETDFLLRAKECKIQYYCSKNGTKCSVTATFESESFVWGFYENEISGVIHKKTCCLNT